LPEPVIRTRFFIPEWVFIFGMAVVLLVIFVDSIFG
jgi:hypothetical protein